ncbi:MAG: hypothetical protein ABEJ87_01670 [Candidatus Nanohalobium sp.]
MEVSFEGEAYPSEDERIEFGYEPNRVYILSGSEKVQDKQHFRGFSTEEILEELDEAFLGFEYVNGDMLVDEDENPSGGPGDVPLYQREAVPAELRPGDEWEEALREIESMNSSVADSSFSVVFYNDNRVHDVDRLGDEIQNTSVSAFPDIRGLQLVAYWPQTKQANLIQYSDEVHVPEEPLGDERGALIDHEGDFRTVEYPRDEEGIRRLLQQHEDWNITKNTLGSHELPPEIFMEEFQQE